MVLSIYKQISWGVITFVIDFINDKIIIKSVAFYFYLILLVLFVNKSIIQYE